MTVNGSNDAAAGGAQGTLVLRWLGFLIPRLAASTVFLLLLIFLLNFFMRPIAMVVVRIVNQESLSSSLLLDYGEGFSPEGELHGVVPPMKQLPGIISFRLPEKAAGNILLGFKSATATTPEPVYIQSIDLVVNGMIRRWGPSEIARDFGFLGIGGLSSIAAPGTGDLLRLVPSGPDPSLFLASGLPGLYFEEYLPALRHWRIARGASALLSGLLLLLLLLAPDGAFRKAGESLSRSRPGLAFRRLHGATPLVSRAASPMFLLLVFAFAFPNISVGNFHSYGEGLEDLLVVQFGLESIVNGILPLWNPYINNGQPFTWNYLMTGFPPINVAYALLVKGASLLLPIDLGHATKLLLLIYMAIMTTGLLRLFSHFVPELPRFSRVTLAALTCYIYAVWNYMGLNITVITMFAFFPYCLYYLFRFLGDRDRRTLWKLVLSFMLLFHCSGPYIVPFTLILGNLLLFGAVFSGPRVITSLVAFARVNYLQIGMMLLSLGLCVAYKVQLALSEYPEIVRIGRDLGNISFSAFLFNANQGPSGWARVASYFVPGDESATFVGMATLLPFCYALTCGAFWRRFRAVIPGAIFLGSVVLMDRSPFLNLIYVYLFPPLTNVVYWGVYFDALLIFYMLFVAEGIRLLVQRFNAVKAGVLLAGLAVLLFRLNALEKLRPFSLWHVATLVPLLLMIYLAKRSSDARAAGVAGLTVVLLLVSESGFHLAGKLELSREEQMVKRVGDEPAIRFAGSPDYPFRARRQIHLRKGFEHWMFGLPLISREVVYNPDNHFVTTRRQRETERALDQENRLAKFGVSRDILWISRDFTAVASYEEMMASMTVRPSGDFILIDNPSERERVRGLLSAAEESVMQPSVSVISFDPNRLSLDATVSAPSVLYYADSWHKDWRVTVNGRRGTVLLANGNYKAVVLPEGGRYRITFAFLPVVFVVLFVAGNLAVLVPLLFVVRRRRGK